MVLSGSKMTSYQSSIKNQNSGGGSKKAGIPPTATGSHVMFEAYGVNTGHGTPKVGGLMSTVYMRTNRLKVPSNQNLPVGFHRPITMR
jgi:hypothetical protein